MLARAFFSYSPGRVRLSAIALRESEQLRIDFRDSGFFGSVAARVRVRGVWCGDCGNDVFFFGGFDAWL